MSSNGYACNATGGHCIPNENCAKLVAQEERAKLFKRSFDITQYIQNIFEGGESNIWRLNQVFDNIDTDEESIDILVVWLRATFTAKHLMTRWYDLLERTKKSHASNERLDRILVGLDQ
jgi:hypothetical protein